MSKGLSGLAVIACISPPLGGLLTSLFSWHVALATLGLVGFAILCLIVWRFEETAPHKNLLALHPIGLIMTWRDILGNPVFLAFSSLAITSYCGLFTFLATSSFVLIKVLGLSPAAYGFVMLLNSFLYLIGTILCRRLIPRIGVRRAIALAAVLSLSGGTLMGVLALTIGPTLWVIVAPMSLFFIGHGIHQPCSQSGAVGPFPNAAGAASALNGFLMMVVAFAMGHWLGTHMDGTAYPLIFGIWFWSVLIAVVAWTLVQRYAPH